MFRRSGLRCCQCHDRRALLLLPAGQRLRQLLLAAGVRLDRRRPDASRALSPHECQGGKVLVCARGQIPQRLARHRRRSPRRPHGRLGVRGRLAGRDQRRRGLEHREGQPDHGRGRLRRLLPDPGQPHRLPRDHRPGRRRLPGHGRGPRGHAGGHAQRQRVLRDRRLDRRQLRHSLQR